MGNLSRLRHQGRGPRPRSNGARSGPLRKILSTTFSAGGVPLEEYECGHRAVAKRDLIGYTNATRRRCTQCKTETDKS